MPTKKTESKLKSPFKELPAEHSHPAHNPEDKRLNPANIARVEKYQWVPGQSGNPAGKPPTKPLSDHLKKILQEIAVKQKKPLYEVISDVLVAGALGKKRITPSQMAALQMIFNYTEGKPAQFDDEVAGRPMIVMDLNINVSK